MRPVSSATTVVVRQKNPEARIVARCSDTKFADRILRAGANTAVSPNAIGGMRMASEALRPHVTSFLDLMLREKSRTLRIDEIEITPGSRWSGKSLQEIHFRANYHLIALAVKSTDREGRNDFLVNPPETLALQAETVVIVMGDVAEIRRAREDARPGMHMSATGVFSS